MQWWMLAHVRCCVVDRDERLGGELELMVHAGCVRFPSHSRSRRCWAAEVAEVTLATASPAESPAP